MTRMTELAKHTPGPWKMHPASSVVGSLISYGDIAKGENVCAVMPQCDKLQCEANARLIAAAPEMAEILLSSYVHVSHGGPTRGQVETVLRKAGLL